MKDLSKERVDLYQNAPCGYLSMLIDGRIINANNTLLNWLNYDWEEVVDKLSFQDLLKAGEKIYFESYFMPLLKLQGEVTEINLSLVGKDTVAIPALVNASQVTTENEDEPVYWLSVLDITYRKQYEQELLLSRQEADQKNKRLTEINDELERFAYTASHDLQAPLNSIFSIVQLIKEKNVLDANSEEAKLFSMIADCTQQMRTMIRDLLEYSKIEVSADDMDQVSLNEVCQEALSFLKDEIENNQAKVHISDLPVVLGIKSLLVRLFQNLFSNAIKYRSEAAPVITVSWEESGEYCLVNITDNGMGFDQEQESKVFGFMQRLNTKQSVTGTGVGLSACKRIVKQHGGQMGAHSKRGEGSTFYFTLAVAENDIPKEG